MQESTLFWGLLVASLTNVLCRVLPTLGADGPWRLADAPGIDNARLAALAG